MGFKTTVSAACGAQLRASGNRPEASRCQINHTDKFRHVSVSVSLRIPQYIYLTAV